MARYNLGLATLRSLMCDDCEVPKTSNWPGGEGGGGGGERDDGGRGKRREGREKGGREERERREGGGKREGRGREAMVDLEILIGGFGWHIHSAPPKAVRRAVKW